MKRIILLLAIVGSGLMAYSQRVYFLYLQTEPVQPFYVKMNGKLYSSSVSGYIILSRLVDSTYTFSIGFNHPEQPEQSFSVKTEQKDHGFLIKDFGEKGWGIVDLQTLNIQYSATPVRNATSSTNDTGRQVSPFTDLLSRATGDPSLRETPPAPKAVATPVVRPDIVAVEQPRTPPPATVTVAVPSTSNGTPVAEIIPLVAEKKEEVVPVKIEATPVNADPVVVQKEQKKEDPDTVVIEPVIKPQTLVDTIVKLPVVTPEKSIVVVPKEKSGDNQLPDGKSAFTNQVVSAKSVVIKRSESSTTEGFGLVFIDNWEGGKSDTIRLLIPNPKVVAELIKETPKTDKRFLEIQATAVKPEENKLVAEDKLKQSEQLPPIKEEKAESNPAAIPGKPNLSVSCVEIATEADFFALRKSMAAAEGDDEMIGIAKKYFKQKCFTAAQLKNLSTLFLNDEARYNFFDAAYKYTADKAAFASLEAELKDPYYINRFKAMIH